jgi:hypothetical protein
LHDAEDRRPSDLTLRAQSLRNFAPPTVATKSATPGQFRAKIEELVSRPSEVFVVKV